MWHSASSFKVGHTSASRRIQYPCFCIMCLLCVSACVIAGRVCTFPPSEASVHQSRGYGLFEESPSHMLTQFCTPSSLGPLHPPFASSNVPPSPFSFPHLPSLHHTGPFPLPFSPSLVTVMLTGTVYNKIEDEVCGKHQHSFKLSVIVQDQEKTTAAAKVIFKTVLHLGTDAPECTNVLMKGYYTSTAITALYRAQSVPRSKGAAKNITESLHKLALSLPCTYLFNPCRPAIQFLDGANSGLLKHD